MAGGADVGRVPAECNGHTGAETPWAVGAESQGGFRGGPPRRGVSSSVWSSGKNKDKNQNKQNNPARTQVTGKFTHGGPQGALKTLQLQKLVISCPNLFLPISVTISLRSQAPLPAWIFRGKVSSPLCPAHHIQPVPTGTPFSPRKVSLPCARSTCRSLSCVPWTTSSAS